MGTNIKNKNNFYKKYKKDSELNKKDKKINIRTQKENDRLNEIINKKINRDFNNEIKNQSINNVDTNVDIKNKEVSMGKVIVVTSGKGGVGKTTTTANIGTGLALEGNKVLLIDTDIGLRNLDVVMGLENRIVYDLVDLIEGRCKTKQALIKDKRNPNLFIIPAAQTRDKNDVTPEQMKDLIESMRGDFDYILIDCPAGIEQGFKNAIVAADEAIIVVTPEVSAVRDADRIIGLLEASEIENAKLIINRIRMSMVKEGNMLSVQDVVDILMKDVLGVVPDDENIVISTNKGEPLVYKGNSLACKAYRNIVQRIMGEEVPFLDLDVKKGFFKRIFG